MAQITKTYDRAEGAAAAVSELRNNDFTNVSVVSNDDTGTDGSPGVASAKIGVTVVSVEAPTEAAPEVAAILNRHGPHSERATVTGEPRSSRPEAGFTGTASAALGVPELVGSDLFYSGYPHLIDNPTPLSSSLGVPALVSSESFYSGYPHLIDNPTPLSTSLGVPALMSSESFCSGCPVLIDNPTPLSTSLGVPTLVSSDTFYSGYPHLIDNPTPLSTSLGVPALVSSDPSTQDIRSSSIAQRRYRRCSGGRH